MSGEASRRSQAMPTPVSGSASSGRALAVGEHVEERAARDRASRSASSIARRARTTLGQGSSSRWFDSPWMPGSIARASPSRLPKYHRLAPSPRIRLKPLYSRGARGKAPRGSVRRLAPQQELGDQPAARARGRALVRGIAEVGDRGEAPGARDAHPRAAGLQVAAGEERRVVGPPVRRLRPGARATRRGWRRRPAAGRRAPATRATMRHNAVSSPGDLILASAARRSARCRTGSTR